jgi:hypothetical protein
MKRLERYDDPELETSRKAPLVLLENAMVIAAEIFLVLLGVSLLAYWLSTR